MKLFSKLSPKIGIDLGSETVRICTEEAGIIAEEPACLAVNVKTQEVVAVGSEAVKMQGRVEPVIAVHWPIRSGIVYDSALVVALLKILLQPVTRWSIFTPPIIMVSVPASSTLVQRETVTQVMYELGAKEVFTIAQPLAASIGAGVPIADASGSFILQLGAGVAEAAVISLGSMVHVEMTADAGSALQYACEQSIHTKKSLEISRDQSKKLIQQIASVDTQFDATVLLMGKEATTGNPSEVKLSTKDVRAAVMQIVSSYPLVVQRLLAQVGPALTVDVIDKGLLLSGGLAQLHGLDRYLIRELGMPVAVVESPEQSVITGILVTLKHLHEFRESLGYVA